MFRFVSGYQRVLASLIPDLPALRQLCSSQDPLPAFWRRDAEAYLEQVQQSVLQPIGQLLDGGPEMIQRSLVQFAQILKWWPVMVETARRLRTEGHRLAQPI